MENKGRRYLIPFAELVDRLTVDQIKEVLIPQHKKNYTQEIRALGDDIDSLIKKRKLKLSSRFVRMIVALAQINLHIWYIKENMQKEPRKYLKLLKLAHQLNGLRNRIKNLLLREARDRAKGAVRTNFNTDGLKGWRISI